MLVFGQASPPQEIDDTLVILTTYLLFLPWGGISKNSCSWIFIDKRLFKKWLEYPRFFIVVAGTFLMIAKLMLIDVMSTAFACTSFASNIAPLESNIEERGMQLVVRCLMTSMSSIGNVLIVAGIFFAFTVAGVSCLEMLLYCSDLTFLNLQVALE